MKHQCFLFGALGERMERRAEMAATEAGEGHWTQMAFQLGSYEAALQKLLTSSPRQPELRLALALLMDTRRSMKGTRHGVPNAKVAERARRLGSLAAAVRADLAKTCRD